MHLTRRTLTAALLLLIASKAVSQEQIAKPPEVVKITPSEYAIYSVVLNEWILSDEKKVSRIVVQQTTSTAAPPEWSGLSLVPGWQALRDIEPEDLRAAFQQQNESYVSKLSAADLKCKVQCVAVKKNKLAAFFEKHGGQWKDFYKAFPQAQGITILSRIGFDEQEGLALVYVGTMRGHLAGEGDLILLEKREGVWKIKQGELIWLS